MSPLVVFIEDNHEYKAEGKVWKSANGVLDYFFPDFEEEYWKYYKAVEFLVPNFAAKKSKLKFPQISKPAESWLKNVSKDFSEEEIQDAINLISQKWDDSKTNGTYFHKKMEDKVIEKGYYEWNGNTYPVILQEKQHDNQSFHDKLSDLKPGCYLEVILFFKFGNSYFLGTCDLLLLGEDGTFYLIDYKTNEKLSTGKGKKLDKPFENLDGSKMCKYACQLSLYALLLEMWGFKCGGLHIFHFKDYDEAQRKIYDVKYYKEEVKLMIEIYKTRVYQDIDF